MRFLHYADFVRKQKTHKRRTKCNSVVGMSWNTTENYQPFVLKIVLKYEKVEIRKQFFSRLKCMSLIEATLDTTFIFLRGCFQGQAGPSQAKLGQILTKSAKFKD